MRIHEIDLLRIIAAIFVVFSHYFYFYPNNFDSSLIQQINGFLYQISVYGNLGVPLFFMISGFVIVNSADKYSLREFICSRVLRIYPTLIICATLTFSAILFFGSPYHREYSIYTYLSNLTLFHRFLFNQDHLDGVYWTLVVEIRFYAIIAILIFLNKCQERILIPLMFIWSIIGVVSASRGHAGNFISSGPYFLSGVLFYYQYHKSNQGYRYLKLIFSLFLCCALLYFEKHNIQDRVVSICMLFIFHSFFYFVILRGFRIKINENIVGVLGGMTYPLYLLHQHIGYIAFTNIKWLSFDFLAFFMIFLFLILSFIISYIFEGKILKKIRNRIIQC